MKNIRKTNHKITPLIVRRHSSRALSVIDQVQPNEMVALLEAARWAPSAYNEQPWRFWYTKKGNDNFDKIFKCLNPFNQIWAINGSYFVLVLSAQKRANGDDNPFASFDAGAACENFALEVEARKLVCHLMGALDKEKLRSDLKIDDGFNIEVVFVVGKPGDKKLLSPELQERENLTQRKSLTEIIKEI